MAKKVSKPERAVPRLSDQDRHKRFLDMAKEVGASEKPEDFDKEFKGVATPPKKP
jgi:hypothetical protein